MVSTRRSTIERAISWSRMRVQLGGGILLAGILPFVVTAVVAPHVLRVEVFKTSLGASMLAILAGYYFFRSLIAFPGIREGNYILPAFSSTYAGAVVLLLLLRLGYSRPLLLASYVTCVGWYFVVYFMLQRQPHIVIGIVPYGEVDALRRISRVTWRTLDRPIVQRDRVDAITADFNHALPDEWERFLADAALAGIAVLDVKQLRESLTGRVAIERLSENADGSLMPSVAFQNAKSALDRFAAAILIIPMLLLFGLVGIVIKLDSTGPMFFRQIRIGYRGVPFTMWKFRTMTHREIGIDARADAITQHNDHRVTRVGQVLRRTRLDELPQILNVLRGEMSWIGPRPEAEVLSRWYEQELPFYRYRHVVRPGITGWAQVNQGHVANVEDVLEKLHYDFFYISNFSLWLDILIVIRTVRTMLTGFGSK